MVYKASLQTDGSIDLHLLIAVSSCEFLRVHLLPKQANIL